MNESKIHLDKWKKPDLKGDVLYVPFNDTLEEIELQGRRICHWWPGWGFGRRLLAQGPHAEILSCWWKSLYLDCDNSCTTLCTCQNSQNCTPIRVHSLYLNIKKIWIKWVGSRKVQSTDKKKNSKKKKIKVLSISCFCHRNHSSPFFTPLCVPAGWLFKAMLT